MVTLVRAKMLLINPVASKFLTVSSLWLSGAAVGVRADGPVWFPSPQKMKTFYTGPTDMQKSVAHPTKTKTLLNLLLSGSGHITTDGRFCVEPAQKRVFIIELQRWESNLVLAEMNLAIRLSDFVTRHLPPIPSWVTFFYCLLYTSPSPRDRG